MLYGKADAIVDVEKSYRDTTALVKDLNDWVCRVYGRAWNIDDIVIGNGSKVWLENRKLLPKTWGRHTDRRPVCLRSGPLLSCSDAVGHVRLATAPLCPYQSLCE